MGLILDTSIPIASERRREDMDTLVERIELRFGILTLALSAVSVVEFTHGIYRAKSDTDSRRRRIYADKLCFGLIVIPVTLDIARLAGRIQGEQAARGNIIAFEDLVIGATALHLGFGVLTLNLRHFQAIPGLAVHTL